MTQTSELEKRSRISSDSKAKGSLLGKLVSDPKVWNQGLKHLRKNDHVLSRVIDKVGPVKISLDEDHYEALVGSIIYQQLAGAAASAILNRFKQIYGGRIPSPRDYLRTDVEKLRSTGLSPQKISYIRDLCERLENGTLNLKKLEQVPDEEVVRELDNVRGVGRWTAEMFLLFTLGRTDVLPMDDLGLQKAARQAYRLRKLPSNEKFRQIALNWHPYSSIATMYLWKSMEKPGDPAKW